MKYYVIYEISEYNGLNIEEFETAEELICFINKYEQFYYLKIIKGKEIKASAVEIATRWKLDG